MSKQFKYVDGVKTNFKQNPLVGENEKVKAEDLNALADYFGTKVDNKLEYNVDFINSDELIDLLNEKQLVNVVWENNDYTIGIVKSLDPLIIEGMVGVANNNNQGNAVTLGNITLNKNSDVNLRTTADYMKEVNNAAVLGLNGVYRDLHSMNPYDATTIDDEFSIASVAFVNALKNSINGFLKDKADTDLSNIDNADFKAKGDNAGLATDEDLDDKADKDLSNVSNSDFKNKSKSAGMQESLNIPAGTDKLYFVKRLLDGSLGMQEFKGGLQLGGFEDVTSLVDETQLFDAVDLGGIYEVVVKKGNENWYGLVICTNKDGNQAQLTGNFSFEDNIEHGAMIARTGINDALTYTSKTPKIDLSNYYTKTEVDGAIAAVQVDLPKTLTLVYDDGTTQNIKVGV